MTYTYKAEDFTATLDTEDYITRFCDAPRFLKLCEECRNYGRFWVCPPFAHDTMAELRQYRKVLLLATKITPDEADIPLADIDRFFRPERLRIEQKMRSLERATGGRALAFAGNCLYCPEGSCTRPEGKPCRHPELVRPSLESYGFDLGRTTSELLGIRLLWSDNGTLPEYLTLVCGLFHNAESL